MLYLEWVVTWVVPVAAAWLSGISGSTWTKCSGRSLTNQWLSNCSKNIAAFPGAFPTAQVVGNPVREDVVALAEPEQRMAGVTAYSYPRDGWQSGR